MAKGKNNDYLLNEIFKDEFSHLFEQLIYPYSTSNINEIDNLLKDFELIEYNIRIKLKSVNYGNNRLIKKIVVDTVKKELISSNELFEKETSKITLKSTVNPLTGLEQSKKHLLLTKIEIVDNLIKLCDNLLKMEDERTERYFSYKVINLYCLICEKLNLFGLIEGTKRKELLEKCCDYNYIEYPTDAQQQFSYNNSIDVLMKDKITVEIIKKKLIPLLNDNTAIKAIECFINNHKMRVNN